MRTDEHGSEERKSVWVRVVRVCPCAKVFVGDVEL